MKSIFQALKVVAIAIVLSLGLSYALAWTPPSALPPEGNVPAPLNEGSQPQIKAGTLNLATRATSKVGIGVASSTLPTTRLDVRGTNLAATPALFENIFQVASQNLTDPLALRFGLKTDATAANRYGSIEVKDGTTNQDLALQPNGGNVGIGTTTPATKLVVAGKVTATDFCTSSGKCLDSIYTPGMQTLTTSQSFSVPSGVSSINVEMWGGGGGGGTGELSHNYRGYRTSTIGGAGAAGAYVKKTGIPVTAGETYSFTVGRFGAAGTRPLLNNCMSGYTLGGTGWTTTMYSPASLEMLKATGGQGGISHTWCGTSGSANGNSHCSPDPSPTRAGGVATGGTTNLAGGGGVGCTDYAAGVVAPITAIRQGAPSASLDHNGVAGAGAGGDGRSWDHYGLNGTSGKVIIWW